MLHRRLATVLLAAVVAACAAPSAGREATPTNRLTSPGPASQFTAIPAAADLAVGPNQRFLLALIGPDNRPITDATVDLAFFKITGPGTAQLRGRAAATYLASPALAEVERGVYVARTDFDEAGNWGIAANVTRPGGEQHELRVEFQVKPKSGTPMIGEPVPASQTLTGGTAAEIERFSSARPPDVALYSLSVADALAQRKPLAVLFASPGFCTSRTCGPSLDVLQALRERYGDRANYIHVEIYKDGRPNDKLESVPAVTEWGLPSEPWLFLIDANGRLVDKYEGSITVDEIAPVFARVLGT